MARFARPEETESVLRTPLAEVQQPEPSKKPRLKSGIFCYPQNFMTQKVSPPEGIDPKPVQIEVAKTLIDLADKQLSRYLTAGFSEVRAKTIFYQTIAVLMLSAHVAAWKILGVSSVLGVVFSALSAGLFCAVFFLAVMAMSGANYRNDALKGFVGWFDSIKGTPQEQVEIYRDILKRYDECLRDVDTVLKARGKILRRLNLMTLVALILSAVSLAALIVA